jgi:hypothetical protein
MSAEPRALQIYVTADGKRPFEEWLDSLKDYGAQGRVLARLERVRLGLTGDSRPVGAGVSELRAPVIVCTSDGGPFNRDFTLRRKQGDVTQEHHGSPNVLEGL